jgi:hypothetical protein
MAQDEELAALDALSLHLVAAGEPITVLRQPDREERDQRAVDFEVAWQGTTVGIEVTSASQYMAELKSVIEFERALEDELRPFVENQRLRRVVLHLSYHGRPRKHQIPELVQRIVPDVSAALINSASDQMHLLDPPPPIGSLHITRESYSRDVVGSVSTPMHAWWVEAKVDEFVTKLIDKKRTQGEGYSTLWVLIFERTGILSADDLAAGFQRHRADLPTNWRRIFYLDGTSITGVFPVSHAAGS